MPITTCRNRAVEFVSRRYKMPELAHLHQATGRLARRSAHRYEQEQQGDSVHVGINKLDRVPDGGGHHKFGPPDECLIRNPPDYRGATRAGFLLRVIDYFAKHGMTIERLMDQQRLGVPTVLRAVRAEHCIPASVLTRSRSVFAA
ncbi:hypothetical protein [Rhodococcus rhodochrous]|uniref:hypothetical protein n=1 Tax=Rhodococcus rhodochrous TaxID=1829 RepID=UPI0013520AF7